LIDRRLIQNFDWYLILFALILIAIGVLNIYSATYQTDEGLRTPIYVKQIYWAAVGLFFLMGVVVFDYHLLLSLAYPFYGVSMALLIGVLLFGRSISGSQRWITLASFSFQPSELVKIALILALAKYFSQNEKPVKYGLKDLLLPLALVAFPALLIMKQPDLGTALLLLLVACSIILFLGVEWRLLGIPFPFSGTS
jgi:rod shape determining protein RodA